MTLIKANGWLSLNLASDDSVLLVAGMTILISYEEDLVTTVGFRLHTNLEA